MSTSRRRKQKHFAMATPRFGNISPIEIEEGQFWLSFSMNPFDRFVIVIWIQAGNQLTVNFIDHKNKRKHFTSTKMHILASDHTTQKEPRLVRLSIALSVGIFDVHVRLSA